VDAFAGSGERTVVVESGGIFDGTPVTRARVQLDGSAKRALAITPPFKHLVFIEQHQKRFAALKQLEVSNPSRGIQCRDGDANDSLGRLLRSPPWSGQKGGRGIHRAVVFLDPFDMAVRWETLKLLAETGAVDVWYLFPLNAVVRQLAHDYGAVTADKQASLDEIFGTASWRDELYETRTESSLFDEPSTSTRRKVTQREIETYFQGRLAGIFPFVSRNFPVRLKAASVADSARSSTVLPVLRLRQREPSGESARG
jgi:three-Cys-motif partner protein